MTTRNNPELLAHLVKEEAGWDVPWTRLAPNNNSTSGMALGLALSSIGRDIDVIHSRDYLTGIVTYVDLPCPIVIIGDGHINELYSLKRAFYAASGESIGERQVTLARQTFLRLIADALLRFDSEELAVRAFALSIIGEVQEYRPVDFDGMFSEESPLESLVFQLFGQLHEIGHCQSRNVLDQGLAESIQRKQLEQVWADVIKQLRSDGYQLSQEIIANRHRELMEEGLKIPSGIHTLEEQSADRFAIRTLLTVACRGKLPAKTLEGSQLLLDFGRLIYVRLNLVLAQERIEAIARVVAKGNWGKERAWTEYILRQQSAIYRMKEMSTDVAKMFDALSTGRAATGEGFLRWLDVLIQDWNNFRPCNDIMDSGLAAARAAVVETNRSTEDLVIAAADSLRKSASLTEQAQAFVNRGLRRLSGDQSALTALSRAISG
jgi:hypothetical protein